MRPFTSLVLSFGAIVSVAFTYAHCSSPVDTTRDAGADGGARDGGADARWDVADTGTQTPCTLPDVTSDWPGWRRLTELWDCCQVDVPLDVAAAVPAFDWKPCQNGRPSCEQVDNIKYNVNGGAKLRTVVDSRDGSYIGLALELEVTKDPVTVTSEFDVFERLSGHPVAAWRSRNSGDVSCVVRPSFDKTLITVLGARALANSIELKLTSGTGASLMASPVFYPTAPVTNEFEVPEEISVSDTLIVFDQQPRGRFVRTKPNSSAYVLTSTPPNLVDPYVHGDAAFGRDPYGNAGWSQYWRVNADGTVTLFRAKPSTHITALTSDATTLYWAESFGGTNMLQPNEQPHVEIWTAPFTDDPATLAATAKMLIKLDGKVKRPSRLVAQNGFVALPAYISKGWGVILIRASDGAMTTIDAYAQGEGVGTPVYVSQSEVWAPVHLANDPATVLTKIGLPPW